MTSRPSVVVRVAMERRGRARAAASATPAIAHARVPRVARVLALKRIAFTVLEADPQQVDYVRRFGNEVHFGDASRLDLLRAAGTAQARLFVLAIDDVEASLRTAALVRRHFPHVAVIARARNRFHAYKLMDLGVEAPIRETWHGSLALADPAAELPACAVALDATIRVEGRRGGRAIAADEFFRGIYTTALEQGEREPVGPA